MHVNEEILHDEKGRTTPETSNRCCIMKKIMSKKLLPEQWCRSKPTARGLFSCMHPYKKL